MSRLTEEIARFLDGAPPDAPLRVRLAAGAGLGACFGVFVPLIAGLWWLRGAEFVTRRGLRVRADLLTVTYALGALVSGALLFALAPRASRPAIAGLAGAVAMLPWLAGIALCMDRGYANWTVQHTILTLGSATVLGIPLGVMLRDVLAGCGKRTD
jgi:hypothetical protein